MDTGDVEDGNNTASVSSSTSFNVNIPRCTLSLIDTFAAEVELLNIKTSAKIACIHNVHTKREYFYVLLWK